MNSRILIIGFGLALLVNTSAWAEEKKETDEERKKKEIAEVHTYAAQLIGPKEEKLAREQKMKGIRMVSVLETPEYGLAKATKDWIALGYNSERAVLASKEIMKRYEKHIPVWISLYWSDEARDLTLPKDLHKRIRLRNDKGVKFPLAQIDMELTDPVLDAYHRRSMISLLFKREIEKKGKRDKQVIEIFKNSKEVYVDLLPIAPDFQQVTFTYKIQSPQYPIRYKGQFVARPMPMAKLINFEWDTVRPGPQ